MIKNINKLSLIGYLGILTAFLMLAACSSHYGEDAPQQHTKGGKGAYLRLIVHPPHEVVLRSLKHDPMLEVKQLYFLFYDQATSRLKYIREASSTSGKALSKVDLQLPSGDYYLVVLANPTKQLLGITNIDAPLSLMTEGQSARTANFIDSEGAIVMSNDQGPVAISKTLFRDNKTESIAVSTSINLEPVLARVLVYGTPEVRGGVQGTAPIKYQVTNVLNRTTILRQLNKLSTGVMETQGDNSDRKLRYAKSPIWDKWSTETSYDKNDLSNYLLADLSAAKMLSSVHPALVDFDAELATNAALYVKECAFPEQAFKKAYAPYVLIAYPYVPNDLTLKADEGWLSYRGQFFAESAFREMITTGKFPSEALKSVVEHQQITLDKLNESKGGFSLDGLNFYYHAYSYYPVFITHFAGDPEHPSYGYYGVVRGNEYRIHLVEVTSAGSPVPILYQSDDSPIYADKHLSLSPRILDLVVRDQEVRL